MTLRRFCVTIGAVKNNKLTYSECVCSFRHSACNVNVSPVTCLALQNFSTSHKQQDYGEKSFNNNLSWKTHVKCIKSKLSSACYAMWSVKPYVSLNTLKMINYSYFHSAVTFGWLFWGTPQTVYRFSGCKRRLLELWWVVEVVTLVENCF